MTYSDTDRLLEEEEIEKYPEVTQGKLSLIIGSHADKLNSLFLFLWIEFNAFHLTS